MKHDYDINKAHSFSIRHLSSIQRSEKCGCFHCLGIFSPDDIEEWVDEDDEGVGTTALCPKCGIDAVVGDHDIKPITIGFLQEMNAFWFKSEIPERKD